MSRREQIQILRKRVQRIAYREYHQKACIEGRHPEWRKVKKVPCFDECARCHVLRVRTLRNAPRKALSRLRTLAGKKQLPEAFFRAADVMVAPTLIWRRYLGHVQQCWYLLVRIPRATTFTWEIAGFTGVVNYDAVVKATKQALALDDPFALFCAIRKAVYGVDKLPDYLEKRR